MTKDKPTFDSSWGRIGGKDIFTSKDKKFREYRNKWKQFPKNFVVGDFPLQLDIEPTNRCNLACHFCYARIEEQGFKKKDIDFHLVRKLIDEGSENSLYAVKFSLGGEPLLHKDIVKMIEYSKKKGISDVFFNTNGTLLTENMIYDLIGADLDRITISVEGYTKDIYEKCRKGAKFETILSNLQNLKKIRQSIKSENPKIRIQTVLLPETRTDLNNYGKFWSQFADEVSYGEFRDEKKSYSGLIHNWSCPQLWQRLAILSDGSILPCCYKIRKDMIIGNAADMTIKEVWHGVKLNHYRKLHKTGRAHEIPFCDDCSFRAHEITTLRNNQI